MFRVNSTTSTLTPEGVLPLLRTDSLFMGKHEKITENTLVFITILALHQYYYKDKIAWDEKEEGNPFQCISKTLICKILTCRNYKHILQRLVELNIIEIDDSYLAKQYSKSYRLKKRFFNQNLIARQIRNGTVRVKIEELNEYFINKMLIDYPYLVNQYNNLQLIHIDDIEAQKWVDENKDTIDQNGDKVIDNVEIYNRHIMKFQYGFSKKMSVSATNYRLHSTMTSFPGNLRRFLCMINTETGEIYKNKCIIDGKNMQPLLICIKMEQEGFIPDADYKKLCLQGSLYDTIASEIGENRDWVKSRFMDTLLFTSRNSEYAQSVKNATGLNIHKQKFSLYFLERFPNTYNWLLNTKRKLKNTSSAYTKKKRNRGGSLLAYEIQRMEANLWIHNLLREIPEDIKYVTIHDSVMVFNPTNEQIKLVADKVREIGYALYGVEIPLTIDTEV